MGFYRCCFIFCDTCETEFFANTFAAVRSLAKEQGWKIRADDVVTCPECLERPPETTLRNLAASVPSPEARQ